MDGYCCVPGGSPLRCRLGVEDNHPPHPPPPAKSLGVAEHPQLVSGVWLSCFQREVWDGGRSPGQGSPRWVY